MKKEFRYRNKIRRRKHKILFLRIVDERPLKWVPRAGKKAEAKRKITACVKESNNSGRPAHT